MADRTVQSKVTAVGGGEIQLGITRKPITAWGGMADRRCSSELWISRFHAILTRLLAPVPNCKAAPNEGPLLALMT